VKLSPADTVVTPGAEFWVSIDVTSATDTYNGWETVISYNPQALTFVPTVPASAQQGCLMVGACPDGKGALACGNTYLEVTPSADSVYVADVLLCNQIFLGGPGRLIKLRFRASTTPQVTNVHIRRMTFATPVTSLPAEYSADAVIGIGHNLAGVESGLDAGALRMTATPNPARGAVVLALESSDSGEQHVSVHDVLGRRVRQLESGWQPGGNRQVLWDGRDESGARVAPGIYVVTWRAGGREARKRVTLLD
jgi:hypothetical protein